jgi:hypothetical protein
MERAGDGPSCDALCELQQQLAAAVGSGRLLRQLQQQARTSVTLSVASS